MSLNFDLEGKPKICMEGVSCKDNESVFGISLASLDNGSASENHLTSKNNVNVSENPLTSSDNVRVSENRSASLSNGGVLENPLAGKDNGTVLENLMISNDNGSVLEDPSASKENGAVLENLTTSMDNGSVLESLLTSKENGSVLENVTTSMDSGSVLESLLTSKENASVLENLTASKDDENVFENLTASKDDENVFENPLTSNDNDGVLEIPLTSKDKGDVSDNPLTSKHGGSVLEEPLVSKGNRSVMENLSILEKAEDMFMRCANSYEDDTFHTEAFLGEQYRELNKSEDADVDIMECVNSGATGLFEANNHDTVESSSSFGDTSSEHENGSRFSDVEVNSRFFSGNILGEGFGECGEAFQVRKKKLTDHWRRFIHPIKWRCRWLELQLKELNSQESRYERELAQYDQRKQFELEKPTLEEVGAKSLPFCSQVQRTKVMKRKKRKRVEDTIDIASYMSHHNLFSYFGNKRSFSDGTYIIDNGSNQVIPTYETKNGNDELEVNDEWSTLQFRNGDDSLERVLSKIDAMQSQVQKLKTRVDKVVREIPQKFSSINMLSLLVPCDALASSQDPVSPPYNGDPTQFIPECDMGDLIMPDSAILSHGEVTPLPNMMGTTYRPQVGASYENTEEILINNLAAEEELLDFGKAIVIEDPQVPGEKQASTVPSNLIPEADRPINSSVVRVQSTVKSVTTPKTNAPNNKRKRGKRKSGSRRWSKRSSG